MQNPRKCDWVDRKINMTKNSGDNEHFEIVERKKQNPLSALLQVFLEKIKQDIYYGLSLEEMEEILEIENRVSEIDLKVKLLASSFAGLEFWPFFEDEKIYFDLNDVVSQIQNIVLKDIKYASYFKSESITELQVVFIEFIIKKVKAYHPEGDILDTLDRLSDLEKIYGFIGFDEFGSTSKTINGLKKCLNQLVLEDNPENDELCIRLAQLYIDIFGNIDLAHSAIYGISIHKNKEGELIYAKLSKFLAMVSMKNLPTDVQNIDNISLVLQIIQDNGSKEVRNFFDSQGEKLINLNIKGVAENTVKSYYFILYSYFVLCACDKKVENAQKAMNAVLDKLENIYDCSFLMFCGRFYLEFKPKDFKKDKCRKLLEKAKTELENMGTELTILERLQLSQKLNEVNQMIKNLDDDSGNPGVVLTTPLKTL